MIRPILTHPDPRLRETAVPVATVDDDVRTLLADLFDTLYDSGGIGLAATQVGVARRIVVIDLGSPGHRQPYACINPTILKAKGAVRSQEGCLSVPGQTTTVPRAKSVEVSFLDAQGRPCKLRAQGLLAACFQHEIDHLDGRLLIDPR